jgi:DNA repair photolyase
MLLSKDEKGGGTETDGSRSTDYCSHCYRMGQFTDPYLTVEETLAMVQGILKKMHVPGFLAKRFTKDIPGLKRWKAEPDSR